MISFAYNGNGQRVSKTVKGTTTEYFYNGGILSGQKSGNEVICFMYDNNADIFGFIYNGTEYFYVKNAQNDVVAITDSTGKVISNYYYDDWGKITETTGNTEIANLNPIRYRSYYYDSETGLYYLNSRYYDAETSRFLNADGVLGGNDSLLSFDLFAYCGNNPINRVDPTGRSFIAIAGLALLVGGMIFGFTSSSSIAATKKEPIDPSSPPPPSSGYKPPKNNPNPKKVPNPNGRGKGWPSKDGGVWVPDNKQHGGPGWTEQFPGGKHKHHYPNGHVREISPEPINLNLLIGTGLVITGIAVSAYIIVNDVTGVGVTDDWLLGPAGGMITKGGILIFG